RTVPIVYSRCSRLQNRTDVAASFGVASAHGGFREAFIMNGTGVGVSVNHTTDPHSVFPPPLSDAEARADLAAAEPLRLGVPPLLQPRLLVRQLHVRQSGAALGPAEDALQGLQLLQPQRADAADHNQGVHQLPEDRHRVQDAWDSVGHHQQGGDCPAAQTPQDATPRPAALLPVHGGGRAPGRREDRPGAGRGHPAGHPAGLPPQGRVPLLPAAEAGRPDPRPHGRAAAQLAVQVAGHQRGDHQRRAAPPAARLLRLPRARRGLLALRGVSRTGVPAQAAPGRPAAAHPGRAGEAGRGVPLPGAPDAPLRAPAPAAGQHERGHGHEAGGGGGGGCLQSAGALPGVGRLAARGPAQLQQPEQPEQQRGRRGRGRVGQQLRLLGHLHGVHPASVAGQRVRLPRSRLQPSVQHPRDPHRLALVLLAGQGQEAAGHPHERPLRRRRRLRQTGARGGGGGPGPERQGPQGQARGGGRQQQPGPGTWALCLPVATCAWQGGNPWSSAQPCGMALGLAMEKNQSYRRHREETIGTTSLTKTPL
ncbi:hypothetical protein M5D96_008957, partial [Drosophila gunungcola]